MIFVSGEQLRALVPMADAIAAVRDAFIRVVEGKAEQPLRLALEDGTGLAMMARGDTSSGTVAKVVAIRPENPHRGLPTIHAVVVWFDGENGAPRFIVDGATLTSLRTGAATGVASDLLAAPDASCVALIGAGAQAADQFRAVCAIRPIRNAAIVSRTGVTAAALAKTLRREYPEVDVRAAKSIAEAVEGAQIVCCATNSAEPVLLGKLLSSRVHVNAIGSYRPEMRELDEEAIASASLLVVDEVRAATTEAGEIIGALASGVVGKDSLVELGQIALERPNASGLTIFKSVGIAIQDWAVAAVVDARISSLDGDDGARAAGNATV